MIVTRRTAVALLAGAAIAPALRGGRRRAAPTATPEYDPWLEVDGGALRHNVREVARLAGGRPIIAVVKNNAYGLGLEQAGPVLAACEEVWGLAVVKAAEAFALLGAGVGKPILLMGMVDERTGIALARSGVRQAPYTDDASDLLTRVGQALGRPVPVHLYLNTGMNRMGRSADDLQAWIADLAARPEVAIEGAFTELAETDEFDATQLERFRALTEEARRRGVHLGRLHAASSHALFLRREALFDLVRPGLALYGAYPAEVSDRSVARLRPACRLKARVVRVDRLERGDAVSYGRNYVAERPTWIATLPVGHADGYPRAAVKGCEVLIGGRLYRVIGAVSASHTMVEVGAEASVVVGDEATLMGPDDPAIHPNTVAERAGVSVYDVLMHLSPALPRQVVR